MSDLQKEIDLLKARLDELEGRNKGGVAEPVKWKPKGGCYYVTMDGEIDEDGVDEDDEDVGVSFGVRRKTQAQAERASIEMRRFNRLLALRDELCGDEMVFDWTDDEIEKYYVYYWGGKSKPSWRVGVDRLTRMVMPCFTNMETAQKACDMLNSGEVQL